MVRANVNISFLDLICSAMGGAVVLAVIFSIVQNPVQVPIREEFILCRVDYDLAGAQPGIRVIAPTGESATGAPLGGAEWSHIVAETRVEAWRGETVVTGESRGTLTVFLSEPIPGVWKLQPFMSDFAPGTVSGIQVISMQVFTRTGQRELTWNGQPVPLKSAGYAVPLTLAVPIGD